MDVFFPVVFFPLGAFGTQEAATGNHRNWSFGVPIPKESEHPLVPDFLTETRGRPAQLHLLPIKKFVRTKAAATALCER